MASRIYLTLDDVIWIHTEQLRDYGGARGVRDQGLILSALLRPQTGYYSDVIEEAAALWESLTMNHGFIDGNNRVAFASVILFSRPTKFSPKEKKTGLSSSTAISRQPHSARMCWTNGFVSIHRRCRQTTINRS